MSRLSGNHLMTQPPHRPRCAGCRGETAKGSSIHVLRVLCGRTHACPHFRLCLSPTSQWNEQALEATPSPAGSRGLRCRQLTLCWQLEMAFWIT